jgi:predicted sulfurtransferase
VTTSVNTVNPEVISKCHICETISDHMVNCANPECNEHVPICPSCLEKMEGACSEEIKITLASARTIILAIIANSLTITRQNLDSKVARKQM